MNLTMTRYGVFSAVTCVLAMTATNCGDSFDLGGKPVVEVAFTDDTLAWDHGIGDVFKLKCANCHTSLTNRSRFVPANTPSTVNGLSNSSFFDDSTQAGKVYDRMFATTDKPMPPNFATPLTETEKAKVKAWLETKTVAISTLCGSSGTSSLTFSDVSATISSDCGSSGCHDASSRPSLSSLSATKQYRRTMLSYLNDGIMPPSNANYKATTAGSALLNWLCFGSDIQ
jgi:hypothetical protein